QTDPVGNSGRFHLPLFRRTASSADGPWVFRDPAGGQGGSDDGVGCVCNSDCFGGGMYMVTSVTSLGKNGLYDWVIQRATAVVLGVYFICLMGFLITNPDLSYAKWYAYV